MKIISMKQERDQFYPERECIIKLPNDADTEDLKDAFKTLMVCHGYENLIDLILKDEED
jgi:hypothetical protein